MMAARTIIGVSRIFFAKKKRVLWNRKQTGFAKEPAGWLSFEALKSEITRIHYQDFCSHCVRSTASRWTKDKVSTETG